MPKSRKQYPLEYRRRMMDLVHSDAGKSACVSRRARWGDTCDNAMCESFLATLECEFLDSTQFTNPAKPAALSSRTSLRASTTRGACTRLRVTRRLRVIEVSPWR